MLRKIVLRSSEDLVVMGPFQGLSRIDATQSIEGIAPILLHGCFLRYSCGMIRRPMSQGDCRVGIPQMGDKEAELEPHEAPPH